MQLIGLFNATCGAVYSRATKRRQLVAYFVGKREAGRQTQSILRNDIVRVVQYGLVPMIYPGDIEVEIAP